MKSTALMLALLALPASLGCAGHDPVPTVLACAQQAALDPALVRAVREALAASDWRAALARLYGPGARFGIDTVACVLKRLTETLSADPTEVGLQARAHVWLAEHRYQ